MSTTILAPYKSAVAVTTSDSALIPVTDALYVGGAGNIVVTTQNGDSVTFTGVPVGTVLPIAVSQVKATSTTATLILALYR
jgi:hypothetical protein